MAEADEQPYDLCDELLEVRRRRYKEARRAGLTIAESKLFADSDADVGVLRFLAAHDCPLDLLPRIIL